MRSAAVLSAKDISDVKDIMIWASGDRGGGCELQPGLDWFWAKDTPFS